MHPPARRPADTFGEPTTPPRPGQVHVWTADLDQPPVAVARLLPTLDAAERARAGRFRFEELRRRFAAGRGLLRHLVSRYLGIPPGEVEFDYGPHGKPSVRGHECLSFNVSASGRHFLAGFTAGAALGVDVERLRAIDDIEGIARRFFAPGEVRSLLSQPSGERMSAFFTCWTRKEAYVKAVGGGLSIPLDGFEVTLGAGEAARLVSASGAASVGRDWTMLAIASPPGTVAAAAVEGSVAELVTMRCWPD